MSALILKDFYVLWKQMRLFLLLLLVFSAIPGSFNSTFVVVYAAMLPYTAMAYDERSKWNQMAAMLTAMRNGISKDEWLRRQDKPAVTNDIRQKVRNLRGFRVADYREYSNSMSA